MTDLDKHRALYIVGLVLKEYGKTDDRLGKKLAIIADGDEDVARECLLVMAKAHLGGAIDMMKAAGYTPKKVAEELYFYADQEAAS